MKTIWKYNLKTTDRQGINMPLGAEILSVGVQTEKVYLWALIDSEQKKESLHEIEIFGTGNPIYSNKKCKRKFIGTYQLMDGNFVGHVFERLK